MDIVDNMGAKNHMKYNILIAGVGGQGTLLASRVLGNYATIIGCDCKLSEVHGMAQRGGSVVTHVKMADKVYSPIIGEGDADILIAFEKLEAVRWSHFLRGGGNLIVSTQEIMPLPVIIGATKYPSDVIDTIDSSIINITKVDALKLALECGNARVSNTIMIGILAKKLGLDFEILLEALGRSVPAKLLAVNENALRVGYSI